MILPISHVSSHSHNRGNNYNTIDSNIAMDLDMNALRNANSHNNNGSQSGNNEIFKFTDPWIHEKKEYETKLIQLQSECDELNTKNKRLESMTESQTNEIEQLKSANTNLERELTATKESVQNLGDFCDGEATVALENCEIEKQQRASAYNQCDKKLQTKIEHYQACNAQLHKCKKDLNGYKLSSLDDIIKNNH